MGYVTDSLLPNEVVFVQSKPHWKVFIPALALSLVGAVTFVWVGVWASPILAIACIWLLMLWFDHRTTEILVTSRRVVARTGIWNCQTIELEHKNIESFTVQQTPLGRLFNYGTVIINGLGGASVPLVGLARPGHFRRAALQAEEYGRLADGSSLNLLEGAFKNLSRELVLQLKLDPKQLAHTDLLSHRAPGKLLEHDQGTDNEEN